MRNDYHENITHYFDSTENAYKDAWDLNQSMAMHYGYWDNQVKSFPQSLQRMNQKIIDEVGITSTDTILDAGCGVGGTSIYIAKKTGAHLTGITITEKQVQYAISNAIKNGVSENTSFYNMDYQKTTFPDNHFSVVIGCESVCYADNKEAFVQEAFRILKPGGRLIIADGFVSDLENNKHEFVSKVLKGWNLNYLETPERYIQFLNNSGFTEVKYQDKTPFIMHSSRRLYKFYFLASMYLFWRRIIFTYHKITAVQLASIHAARYQYYAFKSGKMIYGFLTGIKP